ncbi:MAG TPA: hypothetical protein VF762_02385, partial [Blastocatellia bacterium]
MGFRKKDKVSEVKIKLAYRMHVDEGGKPVQLGFVFKKVRDGEAQQAKAEQALAEKSDLEQFAELLIEPPTGFDDFPLTSLEFQARHEECLKEIPAGAAVAEVAAGMGVAINNAPLADRLKAYFGDDEIAYFYKDALSA